MVGRFSRVRASQVVFGFSLPTPRHQTDGLGSRSAAMPIPRRMSAADRPIVPNPSAEESAIPTVEPASHPPAFPGRHCSIANLATVLLRWLEQDFVQRIGIRSTGARHPALQSSCIFPDIHVPSPPDADG